MANPQIPQYNPALAPFKFNAYYDITQANEANTFDNIMVESVHLFGHDTIYIECTPDTVEPIFGEFLSKKLSEGIPIRMFLEETQNWNGNGDMYSKFGLQMTQESTFHCPVTTFTKAKGVNIEFYPKVGDLIYFVKGNKLFEIMHIENNTSPGFYAFGNLNAYVFNCKMYTYDAMEVSDDDSIPSEIQSLNSLADLEETTFNDAVGNTITVSNVLSHTEVDPVTGF